MKKDLMLLLLIIVSYIANAQRFGLYESSHCLSLSLSGGYSSFLENYKESQTLGGFGSTLGVGYEYRKRGFWFGVNADFQMYNSAMSNKMTDMHVLMKDTEGDLNTYHYKMKNWRDAQNALFLNVPLLFGYYNDGGFYFGAGVKYGVNLFGRFSSRLDYKTCASYDRYIEDFEEMPNHFFTDYTSYAAHKTNKFVQNLSLCGEIGGEIYNNQFYHYGARTKLILKMALCIEYGVCNIISNEEEKPHLDINTINPSQLDINPFYDAYKTIDKRVRPLYVGLKMTLLLTPKTCRTCPF